MSKCTGNCYQGRNCTCGNGKRTNAVAALYTILILVVLFLVGVVGRLDYDAAKVTAQIARETASKTR